MGQSFSTSWHFLKTGPKFSTSRHFLETVGQSFQRHGISSRRGQSFQRHRHCPRDGAKFFTFRACPPEWLLPQTINPNVSGVKGKSEKFLSDDQRTRREKIFLSPTTSGVRVPGTTYYHYRTRSTRYGSWYYYLTLLRPGSGSTCTRYKYQYEYSYRYLYRPPQPTKYGRYPSYS